MEEYKSLAQLKEEMDFKVKMESVMHTHEDLNNWVGSSKVLPFSSEKVAEVGGAWLAKVTSEQCKHCGQSKVTVFPLKSTETKEKDEPKTVKKNWLW